MTDIQIVSLVSYDVESKTQVDAGYVVRVDGKSLTPERALAYSAAIADAVRTEDSRRVLEGPSTYARPERCGDRVPGTVPSWAGEDQISPCRCVRPRGHDGSCECAHEAPADMVPVHADGSTA